MMRPMTGRELEVNSRRMRKISDARDQFNFDVSALRRDLAEEVEQITKLFHDEMEVAGRPILLKTRWGVLFC